jgi:predicted Rossmann fold nucleotide-binding protein DprA/Smf involved in DNA uptake
MTIRHPLSADGLAILALTARPARGAQGWSGPDGPVPLGPAAFARVARALSAAGATPADFLARDAAEITALLGGATEAAEVIARLAARATTLAMEVERLEERGIWLVSIADMAYPGRLRDRLGDSAPPILYGAGCVELLEAGGVAIVGARDADAAALRYAADAAAAVARAGGTVISGGARGVDAAALNGAAKASGKVVGVLAESLERKARSTGVRALVADERLVLVSPYGADVPFSVGGAMGRNRLIYCLADAALVVSTSEGTGGTWAGAVEALKARWVPVHVRAGEGVPAGNAALIALGALALEGDPERAADLPDDAGTRPDPEADGGAEHDQVAEQQTLFGVVSGGGST